MNVRERDKEIYRLRTESNMAYEKIGEIYGVSTNRARQIVLKEERAALNSKFSNPFFQELYEELLTADISESLACRVTNCAMRSGKACDWNGLKKWYEGYNPERKWQIGYRGFGKGCYDALSKVMRSL